MSTTPQTSTLASQIPETLAPLKGQLLCEALEQTPQRTIAATLRHRVIPVLTMPGTVLYGVCGSIGSRYAKSQKLRVVAEVEAADFQTAIRQVWGRRLLAYATSHLQRCRNEFSASARFSTPQALAIAGILVVLASAVFNQHFALVWSALSVFSGIFFFSLVALRLFCVLPRRSARPGPVIRFRTNDLPVYSVLVPVFREIAVLRQLLDALGSLSYPVEKLDIKIIVEELDTTLRRELENYMLPEQFEIVVVPRGKPQTKPRALNYALQFARGELLTIYDAEDVPDARQLLRAVQRFYQSSNENLACVQAKLVFFNANENWLTRQFAAEYATLFGLILPGLAAEGLPLPLGGTSNHFRTDILRSIGGWDPFNVTEDADLGFRLARLGYATEVVDSVTYEEANTQFSNWLKQRARWLKGFLQTWLVHMRDPVGVLREIGLGGFWVLQATTIGVFISALLHPILLVATFVMLFTQPMVYADTPLWLVVFGSMNLLTFVLGYGVSIYAANKALGQLGISRWWGTLASLPFYWILMCAAAWLALYQFIVCPFAWNKTEHGLSKFYRS